MRLRGKITKWKDQRGFGFIRPLRGGDEVFVQINAFSNRSRRPIGNEFVTYEIGSDNQGRRRAEHVEFFRDNSTTPAEGWIIASTIALLFLMFVGVSVFTGRLPFMVLWIYLFASAVSCLVYAKDKAAAQRHQWRTGEGTLLSLGLLGGWPGAFVAQQWLHHKSKKQSFQIVFWGTVIVNCVGLACLFALYNTA